MPQPRKYATRALQQAAYRKRQLRSQEELLSLKNLPSLPAIATIPGAVRWRAMLAQSRLLLSAAAEEMQSYCDADRKSVV